MPTENRSSNTEMASVPTPLAADNDRDLLEYIAEAVETQTYACDQCGHEEPLSTFDIASDLRDYMLAFPQAPVPQPHPDPIAWMVGTAFWWTKEEAERDAATTGKPVVPFGPLSGGVEAEQLRHVIKHSDAQIMRQSIRISNQRAQLAEAQALLRTQDELLSQAYQRDIGTPLKREIREISAALSASAEPSVPATPYPNRLCHIDYTTHPYRCGCLKGDEEAQRRYDEQFAKPGAGPSSPLPPVDGDLLPPIGSKVLIHLARENEWVEHTVVGYYAWESLRPAPGVHRVFVRVRDADGYLNARGLADIRPAVLEHKP